MPDSPMPIPEIEALKELAPTWHVPQSGGCKQDGRNQCAEELLSLIPAIEKAFERETYAVSVLAESTKGLLARAERAEKSLRLALDAYVQERVDQQMRELEHAALDVIEWENEYRTLNNLGKYPPSPFVRLAICASKRAKT